MHPLLVIGVLASAAWAAAGLALLHAEARAYGQRALHAAPAGDPAAGVRYAFTGAMSPTAKESVREHLPSYLAGLAYHAGIFTALGLLAITLAEVSLPGPLRLLVQALLKRALKPELRGLSTPDDVLSNLLATAFVALAIFGPSTPWLLSAMLLLLYVPLGKLRHSLFFFVARRHLGAFFGRRGVFPPGGAHGR